MEAMVAFMVVTVVLTAFIGVLATTVVFTMNLTEFLDLEQFTGTIKDEFSSRGSSNI